MSLFGSSCQRLCFAFLSKMVSALSPSLISHLRSVQNPKKVVQSYAHRDATQFLPCLVPLLSAAAES